MTLLPCQRGGGESPTPLLAFRIEQLTWLFPAWEQPKSCI